MTTSPVDLPPLTTDEEVLARVRTLVGTARTQQLWILFVDGDGRQSPVVVPIADVPRRPEPPRSRGPHTGAARPARRAGHRARARRGDRHARAHRRRHRPRRRPRVGRGARATSAAPRAWRCARRCSARPAACDGSAEQSRSPRGVGARLGAARLRRARTAGRPPDATALRRRAHGARFRGGARRRQPAVDEGPDHRHAGRGARRGDRRRAGRRRARRAHPARGRGPLPRPRAAAARLRASPARTSPSCCACRRSGCRS